ncbi:MAG: ABC transporter permease [Niastella sp.]|uniref:ABC transporter permease n=1 Tax=Niastella sp. TaxID=1869183 RepID=UPI003899B305
MLQSFLKIAFRNLLSRKGFTLINIAGLATGITCCLLIFEYVAYERSYDTFNKNADRIFRVQDEEYQNGKLVVPCASAMPGVAPAMRREFPEVEDAGRLRKMEFLLGNEARNIKFKESDVYYADESIVNIFQLEFREGDPRTVLSEPDKVIISAEEKSKYFGNEDALGKVLTIYSNGRTRPLQVTGVFKNYPANSHLKLSVLVSYPTYSKVIGTYGKPDDVLETSFGWTDFYTYILLRKGVNSKQVAEKLPAFIDRHFNNLPENKNQGDRYSLSLMPLKNIHLYSHYTEEAEANGDGQSVNILFLVAFFIIGIAWINYINLATARSLERAREVGLRKVLGALKGELIWQFMLESLMLNVLALVVACAITLSVNPLFAGLTGRPLPALISLPLNFQLYFIVLLAAGTFLSGIYPALVLSRYQPVVVLKGLFKNAAGGQWLRKGLIIGQFAISIILIAGTMIVYRQLHYMQNQGSGADINETLVIKGALGSIRDSAYQDVYSAFKEEMLKVSGIKSVTASSGIMGEEILWSTNWNRLQGGSKQANNLFHLGIDADFIESYGLKMVAGEPFSRVSGADRKRVILNESAVRTLGFSSPKAAIGQLISGGQNNMDSLEVKGVIADYHNEGLQKSIQPLVIFADRRTRGFYSVKMQGKNAGSTVASIKKIWDRFYPADPYDYFFLDEFFNRQYAEDKRFGQVFGLFAILAIGIACFGLLGLSAYNVLQRTKEIGVRKVLGASVHSLVLTLSKDFLKLIAFAFVIAIPITILAMHSWLQNFAYRTGIPWWIYALAGVLAILIALLTVGFQSLKAALANPVKSLRTE